MSEEQLSGAFWGGDDLSEEEEEEIEEESEEEYSSDGGIFSDSDDEEEERGPVLSGEEKAERDLDAAVAKFREEMSANNWIGVQKEWDGLKGVVQKFKRVWGGRPDGKPKKYVVAVADLEDFGASLYKDKAKKRSMVKLNQKAFNSVYPKIKKANVKLAEEIAEYKKVGAEEYMKDPVVAEAEPEEEKEETKEDVDKELETLLNKRGKKNYDKQQQVQDLITLREKAKDEEQDLRILFNVLGAYFDLTTMEKSFDRSTWLKCATVVEEIVSRLEASPETKTGERTEPVAVVEGASSAFGTPIYFVERLEQEYTKDLQDIDQHRAIKRYIERLGDVSILLSLVDKVKQFYVKRSKATEALRCTMLRLGNVYYMPPAEGDSIDSMVHALYKDGTDEQKMKTTLFHAFYLANHGDYFGARDLLLMTHMQDVVQSASVPTQILHNRAMAKLGICAFMQGLTYEAHCCLSDLCSGSRVKELLGQGTTNRYGDRNETEKLSKRMHMPYHMHINLDLLETVHLISAMLLEVPNMAANAFDQRRRTISRALRKYIDYVDRQFYSAPPENTRETVVAASKALLKGNWQESYDYIVSLSTWSMIPEAERIQKILRRKIQEEGLKTYLFAFSDYYDAVNQEELSALFELEPNTVHSIVSKMIISDELEAAWDQPTRCVVIHRQEPSRAQALFLQYTEKIGNFVENNERILETRSGGYSYKFDSKSGKDGRWRDDGNWNQRGDRRNNNGYQKRNNYNNDRRGGNNDRRGGNNSNNGRRNYNNNNSNSSRNYRDNRDNNNSSNRRRY